MKTLEDKKKIIVHNDLSRLEDEPNETGQKYSIISCIWLGKNVVQVGETCLHGSIYEKNLGIVVEFQLCN